MVYFGHGNVSLVSEDRPVMRVLQLFNVEILVLFDGVSEDRPVMRVLQLALAVAVAAIVSGFRR